MDYDYCVYCSVLLFVALIAALFIACEKCRVPAIIATSILLLSTVLCLIVCNVAEGTKFCNVRYYVFRTNYSANSSLW